AIRLNKSLAAAQGDYRALLSIFSSDHPRFDAVCFSTLMSRLGRLRKSDAAAAKRDERFGALLAVLPAVVERSDAQAVSNVTHALAKLGLRREGGAVLAAVEARADWLVNESDPQHVANTAWAFAKLNKDAPAVFSAIDARADWLVNAGETQHISNTAWAFATLRRDAPKLFSAIDARADWLAKEGKPQEVANTAWAFATLGRDAPNLFAAIDSRADWLASESTPQAISNTVWAFATLDRDAPALFSAVDERAEWLVKESAPQSISNTALAFTELGIDAPNFWACLERRGEAFAVQANRQEVCNTAWALAVGGRAGTNSGLLRVLWAEAVAAAGDGALTDDALKQLVQVGLHAAGDGVKLQSPPALKQEMLRAASSQSNVSSSYEARVARHLTDLGVKYEREFPAFGAKFSGLLAVDFYVQSSNRTKTAIECDGPSHYLRGHWGEGTGRENGRTVAKRRLLERTGWKVINVRMQRKKGGEKEWLARALNL
ncbi:hypothetical protein TeGR_g11139, partial [Tetraparma gracilis]